MIQNIYILLHACSATVQLVHSWADREGAEKSSSRDCDLQVFCASQEDVGGMNGGASDIVKAEISGEDLSATGGLVSNLDHPRFNKTKQHTVLDTLLTIRLVQ